MIFKKVETDDEKRMERYVRDEVFVCEQQCPIEIEYDELDATALHYIYTDDKGGIVGCCRLTVSEKGVKLGRIAVLKHLRGNNYGFEIVKNATEEAKKVCEALGKPFPETRIYINAQTYAIGFYEKLGFVEEGDVFFEANIPHKKMVYHE